MLRLVLESHSNIECFDEEIAYNLLLRETKEVSTTDNMDKPGVILQGFKIPRFTEQLTWRELSDPDYGIFLSFYRNEKVIHVVRDVRDVVSSMLKLKVLEETSWLEKYGIVILDSMFRNPNVHEVFKEKYRELNQQGMPLHLAGALYWEIKNQGYFDLKRSGMPVFAVCYERFVASPTKELLQICHFLGIDWSDALLNHPEYPHAEVDEQGRAIGRTDPRRSIDTKSVGGHRGFLKDRQVHEIDELTAMMRKRLDTDLQYNRLYRTA